MKAAMYYSPEDIRIEDMPTPKIEPDEILVEMKACGVCGSDLMEWYLRDRAPLVLGHEPAGVVVKTGEKVRDFKPGDRVFVHHHVACLTCHYCNRGTYTMCEKFGRTHIYPGGFAEYFRVPAPNLQIDTLKIPEALSFEEATLIEPTACCLRALVKCNIQKGDTVAIIGAGPSGIIHTALARNFGAGQIIVSDPIDYRLEAAKKFGADLAINPKRENLFDAVREATDGRGADVVVVTAPRAEALSTGLDICCRGGTVCIFAPTLPDERISINPNRLFFSEIRIIPSYSTSHIETRIALKLIDSGRVKARELITHRFPLSQIKDAFKTAEKSKECLKVIVFNEGEK
ncbi:MAG: putative L-threonine 3-dehydrogenase [Candidatus Bathyarchaeota archaeon BA1]|nr:MAG: putative L-threonine 3-dehydrogenase [Candidatus Bathyarchaeota archaeon BA1]